MRNELYHYGMPRRSGRYPWGSGESPYQSNKELRKQAKLEKLQAKIDKKNQKNLAIGRERLENRIERANIINDVDRLSRKVGWKNTEAAARAHKRVKNVKEISREILSSEERTRILGEYTRKVRRWTVGLTTAFLDTPLAAVALPVAGAGAVALIGYNYFQKTKY